MTDFIILPGIGGSDEHHWQTRWERANPRMRRFSPQSWDRPDLEDWMAALDAAVAEAAAPPILVAHSLACLLVAHWQAGARHPIRGAFLVAVPDPGAAGFPTLARGFIDAPQEPFEFASLVVASTNDPYGTMNYSAALAQRWGSELHAIGPLGHINGDADLGDWPTGMALLTAFTERTRLA